MSQNNDIVIHPSATISPAANIKIINGGRIMIHENTVISEYSIIHSYGGDIIIGPHVSINPFCVLYGHGGLEIGQHTRLATQVVCIPSNHNFSRRDIFISYQGETSKGIKIGEDVWIGSGAKILDGVVVNKGCVIGAGSVVHRSLPEYSVAMGVPAKVVMMRGDTEVPDVTKLF